MTEPIRTGSLGNLQARIGIHWGTAEKTEQENHLVGLDINVASRITQLADGGVILLSDAAAKKASEQPPDGVNFHCHGEHELKGIDNNTFTIYEVLWNGKAPCLMELSSIRDCARKHLQNYTPRLVRDEHEEKLLRDLMVPLSLEKREKTPKKAPEIGSPEEGSRAYESDPQEREISKLFHGEAFFDEVLSQLAPGQRLVILGEPGAGKTTWLRACGQWVFDKYPQAIPIWISLKELEGRSIEEFIFQRIIYDSQEQEFLKKNSGNIWLLLDGLDESGLRSNELLNLIPQWLDSARILVTSRINWWDYITNFTVYKALPLSDELVTMIISEFFKDQSSKKRHLLQQLEVSGRLRDFAHNPLGLIMICLVLHRYLEDNLTNLNLTRSRLYEEFVGSYYQESKNITGIQQHLLHQALGFLAINALDEKRYVMDTKLIKSQFKKFLEQDAERINLLLDNQLAGSNDVRLQKAVDRLVSLAVQKTHWLVQIASRGITDSDYVFYHTTFQEYFAAQAIPLWEDEGRRIPGWNFFVPHNHTNSSMPEKKYRVFDPTWKEVILFWLGRDDIPDEQKKAFLGIKENQTTPATGLAQLIEAQGGVGDGCGGVYAWKAAFVQIQATAEVAGFGKEWQAWVDERIQQLIKWAFGYYDADQKRWVYSHHRPVSEASISLLVEANTLSTISHLSQLVADPRVGDDTRYRAAESLGKIDPGNPQALSQLLSQLLAHPSLDDKTRRQAAESSGEIDPGNPQAIQALCKLVADPSIDDDTRGQAEESLEKIDPGNPQAIQALIQLAIDLNVDKYTRYGAIKSLGKITPGNPQAIQALSQLAIDLNVDDKTRRQAVESLGKIGQGNPQAIQALVQLVTDPGVDDYHTRSRAAKSLDYTLKKLTAEQAAIIVECLRQNSNINIDNEYAYSVLWTCAQLLSYDAFYAAWNHQPLTTKHPEVAETHPVGSTSATRSLAAQTFSIEPYKQVLTEFPDRLILLIDATSFESANAPAQIIQEICTELYRSDPQASIFTGDCPVVSTPTDLRRVLTNALRKQAKSAWFLIIHTLSPSQEFQTTIAEINHCRCLNLAALSVDNFRAWLSEYSNPS